jgi:urease accessory protein
MAMIARAEVEIGRRGVLRLTSAPPLTLREVHPEDGVSTTLCLVGSAAGPLAGDELTLSITVHDGAVAQLIATGAMIAQGSGSSTLRTEVRVAAGAELTGHPGPLIVCASSRVEVGLDIDLDADATLHWRELVVLGRSHEPAGAALLWWNVTRAGRPLLRQSIDLTDERQRSWPGMLAGNRVMLTELAVCPGSIAATAVHSPTAVTQRLTDDASLTTVLAEDAASATRMLDEISHRVGS